MRTSALAILLLVPACGQGGTAPNQSSGDSGPRAADASAAMPTITIAATGPGGCAASWDGEAVTPAQLTERSSALLERAVAAVGGAQNITQDTFPVLNVQAPADLSFACADTILFALQRAGLASVRLAVPGGPAPLLADFPLNDNAPPPPVPMVIGVGAGGRTTWNDAPVDAAALTAHLAQVGSEGDSGSGEMAPPPGGLDLRPAREATFGQVLDVLRRIRARNVRPYLFLPSAVPETGGAAGDRAGTAPPAPPSAPSFPPVPPPPPPLPPR